MQYWKTYQKDLIENYLNAVKDSEVSFTLWQQHGSTRVTFTGQLTTVSRQLCKIKLKKDSIDINRFNKDMAFFIHVQGLDIIFKKDKYTQLGNILEFSLPSDIQIYERRRTRRFYYQYQDHKNITFRSEANQPGSDKPLFTISSVLVDISTAGCGMVVGPEVVKNITKDTHLFLQNLTDQKLPEPFRVKVAYIHPYNETEQDLYKVGIIFDDELDSISYKSISSIVQIKQLKTQGLSTDKYCGLDFEDQVRVLNNIEAHNKVLANNIRDNIEYLDRLRYMTTQMKVEFLKTVNHDLLAVALRLSSKELIYELFSELTATMQEEFLDKLQEERPASGVCKAQDEIVKLVRDQESSGEILLDPTAFITYV